VEEIRRSPAEVTVVEIPLSTGVSKTSQVVIADFFQQQYPRPLVLKSSIIFVFRGTWGLCLLVCWSFLGRADGDTEILQKDAVGFIRLASETIPGVWVDAK